MASFVLAIFINQADASALTVISVRAVLAQVVLVEKLLLHSSDGRSYRQRMGAGDLAVEVVALGGAHRLNANARLRERGRPAAVGVYNSSDSRECAVQLQVSRRVAGGLYNYHSALAVFMTETAQPRPSARNC